MPLFGLTGEIDPVDRVEEPLRPLPRAPLSEERFEHKAVLSGIGRSTFGRRLMVDPLSLAVDASLAAIADAGLTIEDIDGLSTYPGMSGGGMSEGGATPLKRPCASTPRGSTEEATSPVRVVRSLPLPWPSHPASAAMSSASGPCGSPPLPS